MKLNRRSRTIVTIPAIAAVAALAIGAAPAPAHAPAKPTLAAAKQITPSGVGAVTLGKTYSNLRQQHLVGTIHAGCPLGGSGTRSAELIAPLKGSVDFTLTSPRKVNDITVTGGATARGVGIGAKLADTQAAYSKAKVDHTTERAFGTTLVRIPKNGGGKLEFAIDVKTKRVVLIGIPFIA